MSTLQTTKKSKEAYSVAFQGEIGAYSQSAIYAFFGKDEVSRIVPLPTLRQVFESIAFKREKIEENANCAVVPIENSLAGTIGETLDLLLSSEARIIGEVSIPISHALISRKASSIDKISKVISHPQAIAQCKIYLDSKGWQQISVYDTAGAAKMIKDDSLDDTAAIASELAAEIYGLKVLENKIQDDQSNSTRFIVIESKLKGNGIPYDGSLDSKNYKTSVIFSTKHEPGSLVAALSAFSARGINLTKIESRPIKTRPWEYYFFLDFEGHETNNVCREALRSLDDHATETKVLGSYKRRV